MKKIYETWEEFNKVVLSFTSRIINSKLKFDGIYALPRGGLPLGVALSHQLNLPLLLYPTENTLVVDDISDTGKTLENIKHKKIVTWYTTPWTTVQPYWYFEIKNRKDSWIMFPWEEIK